LIVISKRRKISMLLKSQLAAQPRISLAHLPTPLEELDKLSKHLGGPKLLVKRDDLTGLATGGNKTRKLEFLMAEALAQQRDSVITAGGPQSNHCRQTAAAAARLGLECHLVLGGQPAQEAGNLLLDELLGAKLHWVPKSDRNARMQTLAGELRQQKRHPYVIPVGGSNACGALGYVVAMAELMEQLDAQQLQVDHIVFPTSSGGTQAGMVLGAQLVGFRGQITAISVDQIPDEQVPKENRSERFIEEVCRVANGSAALLGVTQRLEVEQFSTCYDYLGDGYGVLGDLEREAIKLVARLEGMLVGPVYSGRALGGLIDQIRQKVYSPNQTVLFWHTGDETALHAYRDELL
jgi:D-cysteine desulfhydrase family pyridoxal phosphate-dependent enzyme